MRLPVTRLVTVVTLLLLTALAAEAQQAAKVPRIGVLGASSTSPAHALRDGLRTLGYIEGQTIAIDWRWARGDEPGDAAELVRLKVDAIVAVTNPAIEAAQRATKTIPIVMVLAPDPVGDGFVASLARPGGNITGLTTQTGDLAGKRLQLFREALPTLSRLVLLWDPAGRRQSVNDTEVAARGLGVQVQVVDARGPNELMHAFDKIARARADGIVVHGSALLFTHRARIAEHAVKNRLPTMCQLREYVEAGCFMSYAPSFSGNYRRAAFFVDRILKGTRPTDLPVEQATLFELVINRRTAKALALTIPPSLLLRADHVIE